MQLVVHEIHSKCFNNELRVVAKRCKCAKNAYFTVELYSFRNNNHFIAIENIRTSAHEHMRTSAPYRPLKLNLLFYEMTDCIIELFRKVKTLLINFLLLRFFIFLRDACQRVDYTYVRANRIQICKYCVYKNLISV